MLRRCLFEKSSPVSTIRRATSPDIQTAFDSPFTRTSFASRFQPWSVVVLWKYRGNNAGNVRSFEALHHGNETATTRVAPVLENVQLFYRRNVTRLIRNKFHSARVFESASIILVQQIGSARGCGGPYGEAHWPTGWVRAVGACCLSKLGTVVPAGWFGTVAG